MNKEEKDAIEFFIHECEKYDGTIEIKGTSVGEETRILNMIVKCLKEFNGLKEIEQSHQEENGKLRVEFKKLYEDNLTLAQELEQEKEKNIFLEGYKVGAEEAIKELKEKNKDLQKQLNGAFDRGFISKDKIKEKIKEREHIIHNAKLKYGQDYDIYDDVIYARQDIKLYKELLEEE